MRNLRTIEHKLLVEVCHRFIHRGEGPAKIAGWLGGEIGQKVSREQIYPLLREAVKCNLLALLPPRNQWMSEQIADRFLEGRERKRIHVVDVAADSAGELLPSHASKLIASKIQALGVLNERVRIGLCGGTMTMRVAQSLAAQLSSAESLPKLGFHTLTAGYSVHNPRTAPITFLSFFSQLRTDIDYVGLFAPPVVATKEYDDVIRLPGVEESFKSAKQIDIIVTSLAKAGDKHGELRQFLAIAGDRTKEALKALQERGWVGDLMYQPYSSGEPLANVTVHIRPVSLFDLEGLRKLAKKDNKYVVVVVGPCGVCGESKAKAVRPLLESPNLKVWTDLVMDLTTAEELLAEPG